MEFVCLSVCVKENQGLTRERWRELTCLSRCYKKSWFKIILSVNVSNKVLQNVSEYPQNSYSSLFIIFPALFYHFLTFKILFFDDVIYLVEILDGDLTSLTKLAISCQCFIYKIMVIVYLKALDYPSLFTCVRQMMFITNNSIFNLINEDLLALSKSNIIITFSYSAKISYGQSWKINRTI